MFHKVELWLKLSKTETMIYNWNESCDGTNPKYIIKVHNVKLLSSKHFKQIIVWISYDKFSKGDKKF